VLEMVANGMGEIQWMCPDQMLFDLGISLRPCNHRLIALKYLQLKKKDNFSHKFLNFQTRVDIAVGKALTMLGFVKRMSRIEWDVTWIQE
jgi:hypothetical protein